MAKSRTTALYVSVTAAIGLLAASGCSLGRQNKALEHTPEFLSSQAGQANAARRTRQVEPGQVAQVSYDVAAAPAPGQAAVPEATLPSQQAQPSPLTPPGYGEYSPATMQSLSKPKHSSRPTRKSALCGFG